MFKRFCDFVGQHNPVKRRKITSPLSAINDEIAAAKLRLNDENEIYSKSTEEYDANVAEVELELAVL